MNDIVHIEFRVTNLLEAKKFYSRIFDWKIEISKEIPDYMFFSFTQPDPNDKNNSTSDEMSGGIALVDKPSNGTFMFYVRVDNIETTLHKIIEYGGKIILEKSPLPGNDGFIGRFEDPFSNIIGLWSAN